MSTRGIGGQRRRRTSRPALFGLTWFVALLAFGLAAGAATAAGGGATVATAATPSGPAALGVSTAAGPPFIDPVPGRYVYDTAQIFSAGTIANAQATIAAIRERTGAEIVVYTQVTGSESTARAEANARALMDQWGVGRRGFDDGLVILFDLEQSRIHGQVQLYAGPGYAATFLSNGERQAIYENDMLPLLREANLDGALALALQRIDANATPEHAATLNRARLINAIVGLVGAPLLLVLLIGWALLHWIRFGRDPVFIDDPSILMPGPPADLTAAAGALVFDGRSSRHTLTTAMLDLASRDELAFRPEPHALRKDGVGIEIRTPDVQNAQVALNRRRPLSPAETHALSSLSELAEPDADGASMVTGAKLLEFGPKVATFDDRLETYVTSKGWFREKPSSAMKRWYGRGTLEIIGGVILLVVGFNLPADGLVAAGAAMIVAGVATLFLAYGMPARTLPGATIRAMLAAYRRTLQKTMAMSRSMDQVVASKAVPWLETPDQAVVWGVALGLRKDVEDVLGRTAADLHDGRADPGISYLPFWYGSRGWAGTSMGSGGAGGMAPGLFSSSGIPNFGSMMGAIGSIGNSPSSSGGGGFGGGGSGGGGGGAGGGF